MGQGVCAPLPYHSTTRRQALLTALSDAAILFEETLAHQLHQLLTGDVLDQAKAFPETAFVLFFGYIGAGHARRGHYDGLVDGVVGVDVGFNRSPGGA